MSKPKQEISFACVHCKHEILLKTSEGSYLCIDCELADYDENRTDDNDLTCCQCQNSMIPPKELD